MHRPRHEKSRRIVTDRGAVSTEYALLSALLAAMVLASVGMYEVATPDVNLSPHPAPSAPAHR
jgi:hypothetical protein